MAAFITRSATVDDLPTLIHLAHQIWRAYYPGILSSEQIEYMLARFFTSGVMEQEIVGGGVTYFIREEERASAIGFAAVRLTSDARESKLHKLYVQPSVQGQGHGHALLQAVIAHALSLGSQSLMLCVNKQNAKAIAAYERYGFVIRDSIRVDIGSGFVMDDYVMARTLLTSPTPGAMPIR